MTLHEGQKWRPCFVCPESDSSHGSRQEKSRRQKKTRPSLKVTQVTMETKRVTGRGRYQRAL